MSTSKVIPKNPRGVVTTAVTPKRIAHVTRSFADVVTESILDNRQLAEEPTPEGRQGIATGPVSIAEMSGRELQSLRQRLRVR